MSGPGPYGPGRRGEPHEVHGGRREAPFGPDISWPNGFRQLDTDARHLLESGYGRSQYDHADPGYGAGRGSGYRQPAMDDYGDPGYSDPAYDGPRGGSGGSGGRGRPGDGRGQRVPGSPPPSDVSGHLGTSGYHAPDHRESARGYQPGYAPSGIYPVTGAQEALPATGPQPVAESWRGRDTGSGRSGRQAQPEPWYDNPRQDEPRGSGARPEGTSAPDPRDPRLAGMRYDELRYDEPSGSGPSGSGSSGSGSSASGSSGSGYDEPLDDESWVAELRRSAPAYPQPPGGDRRRGDPRGPGYGQQPGWGSQPGISQTGGHPQAFGYGHGRDDRGGPSPMAPRGPRMSAGPETRPLTPAAPADPASRGESYLGAPTAQVGVLTPPGIRRVEDPALSAGAGASQVLAPSVRPGHGLDGPEITSSWPAQPQADDQESFEEFWAEDDNDGSYTGLFPGEDPDFDARRAGGARTRGNGRRIGRRRGRSSDHRLWLALLGVVVAAAAAIIGILKFEFPSHSGPTHTMVTPAQIGSYMRTVDMEKQTKVNQLRAEVIKMSSGQASDVQSAVYESGNSAAGSTEQIVMFIGGHLANAAPASSIASFTQKFAGAKVVSAGSLGGQAACVEEAPGTSNSVAMCVWFDNDSFGEIVSPTMNATSLANVMRTMRPSLELVVKK